MRSRCPNEQSLPRMLTLAILTILASAGCTQARDTDAVEPTSVYPFVISTPVDEFPSSTDIIIDGPWDSLPDGSDAGIMLDPETAAITLASDPTDMVFITEPDSDRDVFTNNVYTLGSFEGRLYLGYGDIVNNQGPVDIVSYDPATGMLAREMEDVPENGLFKWHLGDNGVFYGAGWDSRESWAFGSFYSNDGMQWRKVRTIYRGLHVLEIVEFDGRLYAMFTSDSQQIVSYPFIIVSDNGGVTWQYERLEYESSRSTKILDLFEVPHASGTVLYAHAYVNPQERGAEWRAYSYDGMSWQRMPLAGPNYSRGPRRILGFRDQLIISGYHHDAATDVYTYIAYSWDGQTLAEIPYLRGRCLDYGLFLEDDGWLYALLPPEGLYRLNASSPLVRTQDLQNWEELGNISLPGGAIPSAMHFLNGRLYIGGLAAWREIVEGPDPLVSRLIQTPTAPFSNATLTWDADVPEGAELYFRVQAGRTTAEQHFGAWLGPDGLNSYFTTPGQALPYNHEGAKYFRVEIIRHMNDAGEMPFVRTVTVQSDNGLASFAVDTGSGLYAAANVRGDASFTSDMIELEAPIAAGALFYDALAPEGTSVTFQIRTADMSEELSNAPFVGPDGREASYFTSSGDRISEQSNGHRCIQYRAYLSSENPNVAPYLQKVLIVNRGGIVDTMNISLPDAETWTAGLPRTIQVTVLAADGEIVPINGEIALYARSRGQASSLLSAQVAELIDGVARVEVSLFQAVPSHICTDGLGPPMCSEEIEVLPADAARFEVEAPDHELQDLYLSPHAGVAEPVSIAVTAEDHFGNAVRDYEGTMHCEIWKWEVWQANAIPSYTFVPEDEGSHRFDDGLTLWQAGEYSLVCLDDENPQVGGALAITIGDFHPTQFP